MVCIASLNVYNKPKTVFYLFKFPNIKLIIMRDSGSKLSKHCLGETVMLYDVTMINGILFLFGSCERDPKD